MITLKINVTTNQNYYSYTLMVSCIKLKLRMFMGILAGLKQCLILAIVRISQNAIISKSN